jgi:glutaredoxin
MIKITLGLLLVLLGIFLVLNNLNTNVSTDTKDIYDDKYYSVPIGNPELITRCKKLPPVKKIPYADFGFDPLYIPNSRGNVCDKDLSNESVFPSLSSYKLSSDTPVVPVSSFSGNEGLFTAKCNETNFNCDDLDSPFFPGELLIKENKNDPEDVNKNVIEGFVSEGFIEGAGSCGGGKPKEEETFEGYEGLEGLEQGDKCSVELYYTEWCGYSTKFIENDWKKVQEMVSDNHDLKNNVEFKMIDCDKEKEKAKAAGVTSFPTIHINGKEHKDNDRSAETLLSKIKESLGL